MDVLGKKEVEIARFELDLYALDILGRGICIESIIIQMFLDFGRPGAIVEKGFAPRFVGACILQA